MWMDHNCWYSSQCWVQTHSAHSVHTDSMWATFLPIDYLSSDPWSFPKSCSRQGNFPSEPANVPCGIFILNVLVNVISPMRSDSQVFQIKNCIGSGMTPHLSEQSLNTLESQIIWVPLVQEGEAVGQEHPAPCLLWILIYICWHVAQAAFKQHKWKTQITDRGFYPLQLLSLKDTYPFSGAGAAQPLVEDLYQTSWPCHRNCKALPLSKSSYILQSCLFLNCCSTLLDAVQKHPKSVGDL